MEVKRKEINSKEKKEKKGIKNEQYQETKKDWQYHPTKNGYLTPKSLKSGFMSQIPIFDEQHLLFCCSIHLLLYLTLLLKNMIDLLDEKMGIWPQKTRF